ncbi:MAG TPA: rhomboid family intramembrane serine protease, partial [Spirochaetota bacterium]|nr:rhomboid family intramembrane serine protease [Spirochaetota bacterium]
QNWGSSLFFRYYIITGIGAGFFIALMNYIMYVQNGVNPVTIGASGAIYGILLAYGVTWPNRKVLLYFVIPIKIKYLVLAFGLIEFFGMLSTATGAGGNVSHIGHLGGLITGLLYFFLRIRRSKSGYTAEKSSNENVLSRFFKKIRLKRKKKVIEARIQSKKIIDELLEKIARHGMSSLTAQEKKDLEWARKHYYPDRDETLH